MEQWRIHRDRTRAERACCRQAAQREYYAVLDLPSCIRRDLCAACFRRLMQSSERAPIFWQARRKPGAPRAATLDLASLRMLFDRLGETDDERARGLRYFVALLLLRKRLLRLVDGDASTEGADLVVVDPKVEGMTPIGLFAPELDDARLENLRDELIEALGDGDGADGD